MSLVKEPHLTDSQAMDKIANTLSVPRWSYDTLDVIAEVVLDTGRTIDDEGVGGG
ncbi:hypothetical protein GCM10027569_76620 [Flindersiella endophytica]